MGRVQDSPNPILRPMGFELSALGPKGFINNNLLISLEEDAHTIKALKFTTKSFDYI